MTKDARPTASLDSIRRIKRPIEVVVTGIEVGGVFFVERTEENQSTSRAIFVAEGVTLTARVEGPAISWLAQAAVEEELLSGVWSSDEKTALDTLRTRCLTSLRKLLQVTNSVLPVENQVSIVTGNLKPD